MSIFQEYQQALTYVKALLKIEPNNHQALELEKYIEKKMKKGKCISRLIITICWKNNVINWSYCDVMEISRLNRLSTQWEKSTKR